MAATKLVLINIAHPFSRAERGKVHGGIADFCRLVGPAAAA
jgi:hypothetical protein